MVIVFDEKEFSVVIIQETSRKLLPFWLHTLYIGHFHTLKVECTRGAEQPLLAPCLDVVHAPCHELVRTPGKYACFPYLAPKLSNGRKYGDSKCELLQDSCNRAGSDCKGRSCH
ncbi:hypothetical protein HRR86_004252 [Exophiala dermatitidis]|nr:hypothetical protein HRR86_004252 [Exophiala dermatitidis]KAJ4632276.1 hypothetical protein HRR88_001824 [Exophiala dermatitidis]KAJ4646569.1 hypothetical protein HRR89_002243 [Exophiala dermatitidis]KAJ4656073.1 hypothetical protein HRR91_003069 [Exophiala dermatitidis]KAJ4680619.1 hypothetical protein HRR92_003089 [Exophiala dermatitidis]